MRQPLQGLCSSQIWQNRFPIFGTTVNFQLSLPPQTIMISYSWQRLLIDSSLVGRCVIPAHVGVQTAALNHICKVPCHNRCWIIHYYWKLSKHCFFFFVAIQTNCWWWNAYWYGQTASINCVKNHSPIAGAYPWKHSPSYWFPTLLCHQITRLILKFDMDLTIADQKDTNWWGENSTTYMH